MNLRSDNIFTFQKRISWDLKFQVAVLVFVASGFAGLSGVFGRTFWHIIACDFFTIDVENEAVIAEYSRFDGSYCATSTRVEVKSLSKEGRNVLFLLIFAKRNVCSGCCVPKLAVAEGALPGFPFRIVEILLVQPSGAAFPLSRNFHSERLVIRTFSFPRSSPSGLDPTGTLRCDTRIDHHGNPADEREEVPDH